MLRAWVLLLFTAAAAAEPVLYHNATFYTVDPKRPRAEVMVVDGERIVAVGGQELLKGYEHVRSVDLGGLWVVPGLIDAHGHLAGLGRLRIQLDLRDTKSFEELLERVEERVASTPKGTWILGGRWDNATWGQKELPDHARLSAITPEHPVLLSRVDGHAALANAYALRLAGVTRDSKDPDGGEILRDEKREPTGMLIDNAMSLVRRTIPEGGGTPTGELWMHAQTQCLREGLTGVHDAGVSHTDLEDLRKRYARGELKVRAYVMLSSGPGIEKYLATHEPVIDKWLTVRAVKAYMDGAMGSRGAWMLEPYSDRPGHTGLPVTQPARIRALAKACAAKGYQLCTHAIGDRGNREVLDAYEAALSKLPGDIDLRFRIEHAQCISLDDIPRFSKLGVIASMQPTHATSDMRWALERVGQERLKGCYAWRRLLDSGARLAFGSDFPVESEKPLWGFYAAVTRQDRKGLPAGGWLPDQKLTREEALRLFTLDAAYAAFQENDLGSLEVGKLADFVVLTHDIMKTPANELYQVRVERTFVGGERVYVLPR